MKRLKGIVMNWGLIRRSLNHDLLDFHDALIRKKTMIKDER